MKNRISCALLGLVSAILLDLVLASRLQAAEPIGLTERVEWTKSQVKGSPEPPSPYVVRVAYPDVQFENPVDGKTIPGLGKLVVAEVAGKIWMLDEDRKASDKELVIDVGTKVYGVAVHPEFRQNGYLFVMSISQDRETEVGSRVSRYEVKEGVASAESEMVIIEWPTGGHNGGCLGFGEDGFLYISAGDGSGIADELHTGQDVTDLLGCIMRVDVDAKSDGKNYAIPADNPFADSQDARPEIYSFGHRQIWKFSHDRQTGLMWGGEVGQDLWEMVYTIKKGGNYGWSVMEGSHPFRPERERHATLIEKPIVEHNHNDFRSITGGYVYYGDRLKELEEHYIYGDFDTGKIWSFKYDSGKVHSWSELADTSIRLVSFLEQSDGEILLVDYASGLLHELVKAPPVTEVNDFPMLLSETGLFRDTAKLLPEDGVLSYSVNSPLWSDHATKFRHLAIPGKGTIDFDDVLYPETPPAAPPGWRFPDGTVAVKTFAVELEKGNPDSLKRLETRILHHKKMDGDDNGYGAQVWRGYTYVWNAEQTDALLLGKDGGDVEFVVKDKSAPGGQYTQRWHFPSRSECTLCHTMASRYVLGINTLQMNKEHDYGGVLANQIDTFNRLGLFTEPLEKPANELPKLVDHRDDMQPDHLRARSYLMSNCSHCHRRWGGGNAEFSLLANKTLEDAAVIGVPPGQGAFNLKSPALIVPGEPERSLIYHRMTLKGLGKMPHIASSIHDQPSIELIRRWIEGLPEKDYLKETGVVSGGGN